MPRKTFIIVDLDGTLFNVEHRTEFAQAGQWDQFHSLSHLVTPYEDIIDLVNTVADFGGYNVVGLTGRPEKYRPLSMDALLRHGVQMTELLMRPDMNWGKDIDVKIQLLEQKFGSKEEVLRNVLFVIDDRDRVVLGLRDYGLTVLQPKEGDY